MERGRKEGETERHGGGQEKCVQGVTLRIWQYTCRNVKLENCNPDQPSMLGREEKVGDLAGFCYSTENPFFLRKLNLTLKVLN